MAQRPISLSTVSPSRRSFLIGIAGTAALPLSARGEPAGLSVQDSRAAAELKRAAERADLCSASNATGTGLRGEYFSANAKDAALLVRVDETVDFDRLFDWPAHLASRRPVAARWTGWVKAPITGRYRFHGGRSSTVVVARQPMAGDGAPAGAAIDMAAGRFYPISLEVKRLDAIVGRLQLQWTTPFGARYVVPRALLFLPSATASTSHS